MRPAAIAWTRPCTAFAVTSRQTRSRRSRDRLPRRSAHRREQGARTFELQAAHALGKLYQSTNRAADAYAVLRRARRFFLDAGNA